VFSDLESDLPELPWQTHVISQNDGIMIAAGFTDGLQEGLVLETNRGQTSKVGDISTTDSMIKALPGSPELLPVGTALRISSLSEVTPKRLLASSYSEPSVSQVNQPSILKAKVMSLEPLIQPSDIEI